MTAAPVKIILAIDPGASGGMAWGAAAGAEALSLPMPETEGEVVEALRRIVTGAGGPAHVTAFIEQVGGFVRTEGGQPGSAMFKFGRGFGLLLGACAALLVPVELVTPQRWQERCGGRESGPEQRRLEAKIEGASQAAFSRPSCHAGDGGRSADAGMGAKNRKGAAVRDNTVSIRQPCPPFCWQNKIVLEHIRRHTAESILPNSLLLYFVLTELASDKQAAGDFRVKHSTVVKKCGLSRRTVISRLQGLEQIGVISVFPNFGPDGRQLPSSIRLHGPGELPRNAGEGATIALGEGAIAPPLVAPLI